MKKSNALSAALISTLLLLLAPFHPTATEEVVLHREGKQTNKQKPKQSIRTLGQNFTPEIILKNKDKKNEHYTQRNKAYKSEEGFFLSSNSIGW